MPRVHQATRASPSKRWLTLKRVNMRARVKTTVRARADARAVAAQARTPAKAREAAQPTEASRLNSSNQTLAANIGGRLGDSVREGRPLCFPGRFVLVRAGQE